MTEVIYLPYSVVLSVAVMSKNINLLLCEDLFPQRSLMYIESKTRNSDLPVVFFFYSQYPEHRNLILQRWKKCAKPQNSFA